MSHEKTPTDTERGDDQLTQDLPAQLPRRSPDATRTAAVARTVPSAAPVQGAESAPEPEPKPEPPQEPVRHGYRGVLRGSGACGVSMVVHLVAFVSLGLLVLEPQIREVTEEIVASVMEERPDDVPIEVELEQTLDPVEEVSEAVESSAPVDAAIMGAVTGANAEAPQLDQKVADSLTTYEVKVAPPSLGVPTMTRLISAVPDGQVGDPRAIVDNYDQAFDRITKELMWMLDKGDVLVVWCFDESESMKDDQQEIKDRISKVYAELGLATSDSSDHLMTAVTSYGSSFHNHTPRPTSNYRKIRDAIDAIPVDATGQELMCEAVARSLAAFRRDGRRRQVALILVTDESGDRENNLGYLETAIAEAKAAKCKVYTLGREAVFGYPYVFMQYRHPQTQRVHWLRVDRGPETAFVEQLQTNGFHRRYDAFSSGFGSYEQARLARETNGIFFMLPSVESRLVRGNADKRRYELEAMRAYRPDLRARIEVVADRDRYPLRALIWGVVQDLNPYEHPEVSMRVSFSLDPVAFRKQALEQQKKAIVYLRYLAQAQAALEKGAELRAQEADPRWQANYDLILGQIVAYQARMYEYGMTLEDFLRNPQTAPLVKPPDLRLVHWDIGTRSETRSEESKPYIDKSRQLLDEVIVRHPGTPWAERAKWELNRGFGTRLVPDYDRPYVQVSNPSPLPKL